MVILDAQFGRVSVAYFDGENEFGWVWKKSEFEEETGITIPECYYAHYEDGYGVVFKDRQSPHEPAVVEVFVEQIRAKEELLKNLVVVKVEQERQRLEEENKKALEEIETLRKKVEQLEALVTQPKLS